MSDVLFHTGGGGRSLVLSWLSVFLSASLSLHVVSFALSVGALPKVSASRTQYSLTMAVKWINKIVTWHMPQTSASF